MYLYLAQAVYMVTSSQITPKGAAPAAPAPAAPLREPLSRRALTARAGNEEALRCGWYPAINLKRLLVITQNNTNQLLPIVEVLRSRYLCKVTPFYT